MTSDDIMKLAETLVDTTSECVKSRGAIACTCGVAYTALRTAVESLVAERDRLREALNEIASWSEGDEVNSGFDEPESARTARAALEGKK